MVVEASIMVMIEVDVLALLVLLCALRGVLRALPQVGGAPVAGGAPLAARTQCLVQEAALVLGICAGVRPRCAEGGGVRRYLCYRSIFSVVGRSCSGGSPAGVWGALRTVECNLRVCTWGCR